MIATSCQPSYRSTSSFTIRFYDITTGGTGDDLFWDYDDSWGNSIHIEAPRRPEKLDLKPAPKSYWPAGVDVEPSRPSLPTLAAFRWREWAHARRHPRHDRAPPILLAA